MRRSVWVVMSGALALAGCQTAGGQSGGQASGELPPADYRQIAAAHVRTSFFDPYSIREAEIAAPKLAAGPSLNSDGFKTPWVVCMRANAKNRMGGYTGRKVTALAVSGGKVVNSWDEASYAGMVCGGVVYDPFPEIEEGYRPTARR